MASEPSALGAVDARAALRSGALTAEALARACLARTLAREPQVHAWAHLDPGLVIDRARALDAMPAASQGRLHGIPVGIKDVILTADMPTQYNSALYQGHAPAIDAACVGLLREAGALVFGKTETVEFAATGRVAPTCNPHRLDHTPGGSSSGSAAAVADFHVPLALGTQTGGSIIRPASYCGVWGLKPSWNLVSREGAKVFAESLDTIGGFARSAADLALLFDVFDPDADTAAAPPFATPFDWRGARIAACPSPSWPLAEAATRDAFATAVECMRAHGAQVEVLNLPPPFERLVELQRLIMRAEGRSAFLVDYRRFGTALHPSLREPIENADGLRPAQLVAAYDIAAQCRATFDALAERDDAVLTPSSVGEAPQGLAATGSYVFNAMWSLLQVPCINVPGLTGPTGLPVGLTLTGPRFADRRLLGVAAALGDLLARR